MYTSKLSKGIPHTHTKEASVVCATYSITDEQNRYMTQIAMATLLVVATIIATFVVS